MFSDCGTDVDSDSVTPGHSLSGSRSSRLKTDASLKAPSVSGDGGRDVDSSDGGVKPLERSGTLSRCSRTNIETSAIGMN